MVKVSVVMRQKGVCKCGCGQQVSSFPHTGTKFDHRPPLRLRDINKAGTDYEPPQHSVEHLDAICDDEHKRRTHGSGATTAGTDAGNIKKERKRENRARGITKKKAKIRSPGFRKDITRGFDGKTRKRGQ